MKCIQLIRLSIHIRLLCSSNVIQIVRRQRNLVFLVSLEIILVFFIANQLLSCPCTQWASHILSPVVCFKMVVNLPDSFQASPYNACNCKVCYFKSRSPHWQMHKTSDIDTGYGALTFDMFM